MFQPLPPWVFTNRPQVSWCTRYGWRVASWNCSRRASNAYFVFLSAWKWSIYSFQHLMTRSPSSSLIASIGEEMDYSCKVVEDMCIAVYLITSVWYTLTEKSLRNLCEPSSHLHGQVLQQRLVYDYILMPPSGPPLLSSLHAAAIMCPLNTFSNASWHACMSSFGLFAFGNHPSLVKSWFSDPWSLGLILTSFCHINYRKSKVCNYYLVHDLLS